MKRLSLLFVCSTVLVFMLSAGFADFSNSYAWEKKRQPTKSGIRTKSQAAAETGVAKWESLSPDEQEYIKQEARARGKKAAITGKEYWDTLSEEEQQQAIARSREGVQKGRRKWQSLPE
jgi:hypothetical protein